MQKIIEVFRVQRHDFINHLQVISGLLQLGKIDRVNEYIAKVSQDIALEGLLTRIVHSELVAVILINRMEALKQAINFQWDANTDLSTVELSEEVPELVDFILKMAIAEVMGKPGEEKLISININEEGQQCFFNIRWLPVDSDMVGFKEQINLKAEKCRCQLQFAQKGTEAGVSLLF